MRPAAAREGSELGHPRPRQGTSPPAPPLSSRFWGAPQTPAGGLRPPALLLKSYKVFLIAPGKRYWFIWQKREKRLWESNHLTITMLYLVILETEVVMGTVTGRRTAMAVIMVIASKVFRSSKA